MSAPAARMRITSVAVYPYEVVVIAPSGHTHRHELATDRPLEEGDLVPFADERWLVVRIEPNERGPFRAVATPARFRIVLRHADGREEVGAVEPYRDESPWIGHAFATGTGGGAMSWQVTGQRRARDAAGPLIELVAERDFAELEALPRHELEHRPLVAEAAHEALARAERAGLSVEMAALEVGQEADWDEAGRFVDALILEEVDERLLALCGVDADRDPRDRWLDIVGERLRSDLQRLRDDVEGDRDEVSVWQLQGRRIFASAGMPEDEEDPDKAHGWMCRLLDSGALGAAGFKRVRKADLATI